MLLLYKEVDQLYVYVCVCVCMCVQLCPTLCDLMDYNLLGSSVYGIFQAGILEEVAISSSRVSSTEELNHVS